VESLAPLGAPPPALILLDMTVPRAAALPRELRPIRDELGKRLCAIAIWYGYADRENGPRLRMSQPVGEDAPPS
jgi:hypothetical protein